MSTYNPDTWVILKISNSNETLYKILAGWYGGYTAGDSWKLNSGITSFTEHKHHIEFYGYSGSSYECPRCYEKMSVYTHSIFVNFVEQTKKVPDASIELISFEDFKKEFVPEKSQ